MRTRLHPPRLIHTLLALAVTSWGAGAALGAFTPPPLPPAVNYPSGKIVKVTAVGAVADGKTLASDAIKKAIDVCAAAGGGIVQFPRGEYLTGPIHLKSNITLQIDEGATLKFSTDRSLYPLVKSRYESVDIMNYSPLIYAYQCENIRITGKGTLDGQGQDWWTWARSSGRGAAAPAPAAGAPAAPAAQRGGNSGQGVGGNAASRNLMLMYTNDREGKYPLEERIFGDKNPGFRVCFIEPYECKNVLIEGVTLRQSPFWNIHPVYSENVTIRGVTVFGDGPNTDGVDPDSCKTVLIEDSTFNTGDDCIVIKSGRDGDGIRRNATCENITIRNCVMNGGHGAITMGSETSAGIKHVFAENCKVNGPDSAVRLKSTRGRGGGVEDVYVRNITVDKTLRQAIIIDMMYSTTQPAPFGETTPVFKDITIENLTCEAAPQAILMRGLEESHIQNVTLKNVSIKATRGAAVSYVDNLKRDNVTITPASGEAWTITNSTEAK